MNLGTLKELKSRLISRWNRGYYLKADNCEGELFPLLERIKCPTASELTESYSEVREWIDRLRENTRRADLEIEWKEINHRLYGRNELPKGILFYTIENLAGFLGRRKELEKFRKTRGHLTTVFPALQEWCDSRPFELLGCGDVLDRLISVTEWILQNPQPEIYLRQLSLPGVDTKFVERHRGLLSSWLEILLPPESINSNFKGKNNFEKRYGFLSRPGLIRVRFLDPLHLPFNFTDITVTAEEFALWNPKVQRIFVVENDVTALAFPRIPESLLIFGRGYGFTDLAGAKWLREKEINYWGDIDTHGFAILSQFRSIFPLTGSFFMDRETLLKNEAHWGRENRQISTGLPGLTKEEHTLYDDLRFNRIRENLRLEQEFIDFSDLIGYTEQLFDVNQ